MTFLHWKILLGKASIYCPFLLGSNLNDHHIFDNISIAMNHFSMFCKGCDGCYINARFAPRQKWNSSKLCFESYVALTLLLFPFILSWFGTGMQWRISCFFPHLFISWDLGFVGRASIYCPFLIAREKVVVRHPVQPQGTFRWGCSHSAVMGAVPGFRPSLDKGMTKYFQARMGWVLKWTF